MKREERERERESVCVRESERVRTRWVWFGFAILTQNFGQALLAAIPTATVIRKGEAENEREGVHECVCARACVRERCSFIRIAVASSLIRA